MREFWELADRIPQCSCGRSSQWIDKVIWQGEDLGMFEGTQLTLSMSLQSISLTSSVGRNMLFIFSSITVLISEPHGRVRPGRFFSF